MQGLFQFIRQAIRPFIGWVTLQLTVTLILATFLSYRPLLLKQIFDHIQGYDRPLVTPILLFLATSWIQVLLYRLYDLSWYNINPPMKRHLGLMLNERMMEHSHSLYLKNLTGALGSRMKDVMSGVPDLIKMIIEKVIAYAFAIVIALLTVASVSPKIAALFAAWIVLFLLIGVYAMKKIQPLSYQASLARSHVIGKMVDMMANMLSIRLFAQQNYEHHHLERQLNRYVASDQARDAMLMYIHTLQGISFVLYESLCFYALYQGFQSGYLSSGDLILIFTINISVIDLLWSIVKEMGQMAKVWGEVNQGLAIALAPIEIKDRVDAAQLHVSHGTITFDQVCFAYPDKHPLFEKLSVTIPGQKKVGLVGYSGSGKSSFVHLMLRLFDIESGSIAIDGQAIDAVTQKSLHAAISVVAQEPALFHRSILENICYGRLDATEREIEDAIAKAQLAPSIAELPKGLDTVVGERGQRLSGGQRQRIAIARAILKKSPILVFDEPTAQLDALTESELHQAMLPLTEGRTTLVIAHRLSTLMQMDHLLVFDRGRIVQQGTHTQLLKEAGLYRLLWKRQTGGFLPEIENGSASNQE